MHTTFLDELKAVHKYSIDSTNNNGYWLSLSQTALNIYLFAKKNSKSIVSFEHLNIVSKTKNSIYRELIRVYIN